MHVFGSLRCSKHNKYGGLSAMKIRRNILPLNFFGPAAVEYRYYYIYSHLAHLAHLAATGTFECQLHETRSSRSNRSLPVACSWDCYEATGLRCPPRPKRIKMCVYMCAQMCIDIYIYIYEYMRVCVLMIHW